MHVHTLSPAMLLLLLVLIQSVAAIPSLLTTDLQTGVPVDISGNNHVLTIGGPSSRIVYDTTRQKYTYETDLSTQATYLTTDLVRSNAFTVCLWLKFNGQYHGSYEFGQVGIFAMDQIEPMQYPGGMAFQMTPSGQVSILRWYPNSVNAWIATYSGTHTFLDWSHVCVTYDLPVYSTTLYVDSVAYAGTTTRQDPIDAEYPQVFVFGGRKLDYLANFPGRMYDMRVYDGSLTSSQVQTVYQEMLTWNPTTPAPTTTQIPTTLAPTTLTPTTKAPTTLAPTTTSAPTTPAPTTTSAPTTRAPTTLVPTTHAPTTLSPTTQAPTTTTTTTSVPTTQTPTLTPTQTPTTAAPTSTPTPVVSIPSSSSSSSFSQESIIIISVVLGSAAVISSIVWCLKRRRIAKASLLLPQQTGSKYTHVKYTKLKHQRRV